MRVLARFVFARSPYLEMKHGKRLKVNRSGQVDGDPKYFSFNGPCQGASVHNADKIRSPLRQVILMRILLLAVSRSRDSTHCVQHEMHKATMSKVEWDLKKNVK